MSEGQPEEPPPANTSRFPRSPDGKISWPELAKAILQSQVGGWIIACVVFAFMAKWIIADRQAVYNELANLRGEAMTSIREIREDVQTILEIEKSKLRKEDHFP